MLAYILTKSVNVMRCQLWWGKHQNVNIIIPCFWGKALTFTIWKQGLKVFPEISCKCGVERHFSGSLCLSNSVHSHSNSKGLFELEFSDIPSTFHCPTQITFNWSALQFQSIPPFCLLLILWLRVEYNTFCCGLGQFLKRTFENEG